jgi:flagellar basal body-associated protein FliL
MAEDVQDKQPEKAPDQPKGKGKTMIMLGVVVVVEAVVIIGAMMFIGKPATVKAEDQMPHVELSEEDRIVETQVLEGRLANSKSGTTYLYQVEVYVQSRKKFEERVKAELEQFKNEVKADISAIWRTAEPHCFQEPKLETLTRKVYALLNDRIGSDDETGEPVVSKCVIVMGTGFRVDG